MFFSLVYFPISFLSFSTTCTDLDLPHTTETTDTTALTGQCRQPQAPLAKRPGTSSLRKAVRQVASAPSLRLTTRATSGTSHPAPRPPTSTRRHTRRIMESSSEPDSDDALPKHAYQELLEAFRLRHCISTQIDGIKLDNGFTELIDYALSDTRVLVNNWSHKFCGGHDPKV